MVTTDDVDLQASLQSLSNQGRSDNGEWLEHDRLGYNYRLDEMSAAVGVAQLERIDAILARARGRRGALRRAARRRSRRSVCRPPDANGDVRSWFVYVVKLDPEIDRNLVMAKLRDRGVASKPYLPVGASAAVLPGAADTATASARSPSTRRGGRSRSRSTPGSIRATRSKWCRRSRTCSPRCERSVLRTRRARRRARDHRCAADGRRGRRPGGRGRGLPAGRPRVAQLPGSDEAQRHDVRTGRPRLRLPQLRDPLDAEPGMRRPARACLRRARARARADDRPRADARAARRRERSPAVQRPGPARAGARRGARSRRRARRGSADLASFRRTGSPTWSPHRASASRAPSSSRGATSVRAARTRVHRDLGPAGHDLERDVRPARCVGQRSRALQDDGARLPRHAGCA